jgi:Na+/proline symporter
VKPKASERELIVVGKVSVVLLMVLSAVLTPFLTSVGAVFHLILQIGAGTGLIYLLRWFWMRINAWSEITAMAVSFVMAVTLQLACPQMPGWQRLLAVMAVTTVAWVSVTFLTPPTEAAKRARFQDVIRADGHDIAWGLLATFVGAMTVYSLIFSSGAWIFGETAHATVATVVAACCIAVLFPIMRQLNGRMKP